ncbi:MAG: hypothetical protein ACI4AD_06830 [Roseburia sp.]
MKKVKQILALLGVILLIGLYAATLICALSGSDNYMNLLMASVYATVIVPVLIWAYTFIYRLLKTHYGKDENDASTEDEKTRS